MQDMPRADEVPLMDAALRIQRDYQTARALMLRGEMHGRKIGVRWYVAEVDVARLERQHADTPLGQPA